MFKPSETRPGDVPGKWEPDNLEGVFAGYEMSPGYHWSKRFYCWAITDFDGLCPRKGIKAEDYPLREPFRASRLVVPPGLWTFPLKARYEHVNSSLEGDAERAQLDRPPFVAPDNLDPAGQDLAMQDAPNLVIENLPRYDEEILSDAEVEDLDLGDNLLDDEPAGGIGGPGSSENNGAADKKTQSAGEPGLSGAEGSSESSADKPKSMLERWAEDGPPPASDMKGSKCPDMQPPPPTSTKSTSPSSSSPPVSPEVQPHAGEPGLSGSGGTDPGGKPTHKGKHGEIVVCRDGRRYKCSSYKRGDSEVNTWYEIDESGSRMLGHSARPPDIGAKRWAKMPEAQQLEEIGKYHDRLRAQSGEAGSSGGPGSSAACSASLDDGQITKFSSKVPDYLLLYNK